MRHKQLLMKLRVIKNKYKLLTLLISLVLFFSLLYIQTVLQIKTITIQSTEESQLLGLEEIKGRNMLLSSEKEIQSLLLFKNPAINTIEVEKEYPDILRLKISYLQPFVQFQTNSNYLILGKSGKIIEKKKE